jgi:hypothetical protein
MREKITSNLRSSYLHSTIAYPSMTILLATLDKYPSSLFTLPSPISTLENAHAIILSIGLYTR